MEAVFNHCFVNCFHEKPNSKNARARNEILERILLVPNHSKCYVEFTQRIKFHSVM